MLGVYITLNTINRRKFAISYSHLEFITRGPSAISQVGNLVHSITSPTLPFGGPYRWLVSPGSFPATSLSSQLDIGLEASPTSRVRCTPWWRHFIIFWSLHCLQVMSYKLLLHSAMTSFYILIDDNNNDNNNVITRLFLLLWTWRRMLFSKHFYIKFATFSRKTVYYT